jgi:hypothetical protein
MADRQAPPHYPVPAPYDDKRFRVLWDYWLARWRDGRLPGRADIEPLDLRQVLGHVVIFDVVREDIALRFRHRLWGTKAAALFGEERTGIFVDELRFAGAARIQSVLEGMVHTHRPHFWRRPLPPSRQHDFLSYRRLALPLATDGETVDQIINMMIGDVAPAEDC